MSLKRRDNVGREVGARRAHLAKMMDERMTGELTEIEFEHQVRLGSLFGNLCPRTLCSTALALCLDPRTLNALCIEQRLWNTGCIDPRTLNALCIERRLWNTGCIDPRTLNALCIERRLWNTGCIGPRTLNALCIERRLWNTGCIGPRTLNPKPDHTGAEDA